MSRERWRAFGSQVVCVADGNKNFYVDGGPPYTEDELARKIARLLNERDRYREALEDLKTRWEWQPPGAAKELLANMIAWALEALKDE